MSSPSPSDPLPHEDTASAAAEANTTAEDEEEQLPQYDVVRHVEHSAADLKLLCKMPQPHHDLLLPVRAHVQRGRARGRGKRGREREKRTRQGMANGNGRS